MTAVFRACGKTPEWRNLFTKLNTKSKGTMLFGNTSYTVGKPVFLPFQWYHVCEEQAFVGWAAELSMRVAPMKDVTNLLCPRQHYIRKALLQHRNHLLNTHFLTFCVKFISSHNHTADSNTPQLYETCTLCYFCCLHVNMESDFSLPLRETLRNPSLVSVHTAVCFNITVTDTAGFTQY